MTEVVRLAAIYGLIRLLFLRRPRRTRIVGCYVAGDRARGFYVQGGDHG
jgi:hypothetical protein